MGDGGDRCRCHASAPPGPLMSTVGNLSCLFGCLMGGMWTGMILFGNLGGTSVFGHMRELHPSVYGMIYWFEGAALGFAVLGGLIAAYRIGRIVAALQAGALAGFIGGAIVSVTLIGITLLFHDAMMLDPSNVHEFALSAHRPPTQAELSDFLYTDAWGGALNMMWLGPLVGFTLGGLGVVAGKGLRDGGVGFGPES